MKGFSVEFIDKHDRKYSHIIPFEDAPTKEAVEEIIQNMFPGSTITHIEFIDDPTLDQKGGFKMQSIVEQLLALEDIDQKSIRNIIMGEAQEIESIDIITEPNGEKGLAVKTNTKTYKYTVDKNSEKYDTLDKLLKSVTGIFKYSNSVGKVFNFLKDHAIPYSEAEELLSGEIVSEETSGVNPKDPSESGIQEESLSKESIEKLTSFLKDLYPEEDADKLSEAVDKFIKKHDITKNEQVDLIVGF